MRKVDGPPEPWRSFFDELDRLLPEPVELRCFGGFALIYRNLRKAPGFSHGDIRRFGLWPTDFDCIRLR
jgi:hypothetical protein